MFWDLSEVRSCHRATQCLNLHTARACRDGERGAPLRLHHASQSEAPDLTVSVLTGAQARNHRVDRQPPLHPTPPLEVDPDDIIIDISVVG